MHDHAPIIAIATAPGRGGIGVIRISGSNLSYWIREFLQRDLQPRYAHYLPFKTIQGEVLDEGIALFFPAPHSYTGEDVLELQGHGGPAVLKRVLERCLESGDAIGMRLAQPGEFTQRAFLNNKMDLAQAEAVADLINASSVAAARGAISSLSGKFSKQVQALSDQIIHLRTLVEATLDFPEEELDFLEKLEVLPILESISKEIKNLFKISQQGMILREGLHVVLVGSPNVGKSSLLNALTGEEVAIVTPIAGTTRDKVTQVIHIEGVPLYITDTAGLRSTQDMVESLGIERTWHEVERADIVLHIQDVHQRGDNGLDNEIKARLPAHTPVLEVVNKIDLLSPSFNVQSHQLGVSAKTGLGLDKLRSQLLHIAGWNPNIESPWLARQRHLYALEQASQYLEQAGIYANQQDQALDLFAEELRLAHQSLCSITGEFSSDDLLGEIFSKFCIGK